MDNREYRKYVKPLLWQSGPDGLYPGDIYWMEGVSHMESINLCFAFTYIKEPCTMHPISGMIKHSYDEVLVFASLNRDNIRDLGGELTIELGEEKELHVIDKPTVICIPAGMPHGPVRINRVDSPFVHYALSLSKTYDQEIVSAKGNTDADSMQSEKKYGHLLKDFVFNFDPNDKSEMGYAMAVKDGIAHPADAGVGPGNADSLLWLFGDELENFEINFTWGHYSRCGKWHRAGETQTHPEEEAIFFVGLNPDDPSDFQAEMEQGLGPAGERYIINSPSVYVIPPNLEHLPVLIRWVDEPYGLVVVGLAAAHASAWETMVEDLI